MKDFKKEMENRIYYELQKDPKIKELQELQRVNTIKARYFDFIADVVLSGVAEGLENSYNFPDSPYYNLFCAYERLNSLYISSCYDEIGEQNEK